MKASNLFEIYERDLTSLRKEIDSYASAGDLWKIDKQISNSAGNLCLHLIGNLNHFIGNVLGKSGYIRNREAEFSIKNVPAKELDLMIENTIVMIREVFDKLNEHDLTQEFPLEIMGKRASTEFWLIHFACHINYHLGQINYHRRLL
jgi:Protein of unknown function (DUF1572)